MRSAISTASSTLVAVPLAGWAMPNSRTMASKRRRSSAMSMASGDVPRMRTPAASNTKINDVDADGSQEYLCTDTDLIIVTKRTTTGWVAQSITKLGAVRTAVIPD